MSTQQMSPATPNKLEVMPIPKLLLSVSLPLAISMLVQALYNVVDSVFVAQLSEEALNAVSLVFPFQNLLIAVSTGTGVGISALASRYLGEHHPEQATKVAENGLFVAALSALFFTLIGTFGAEAFFRMQVTDPTIIRYGSQYLFIIALFSVSVILQITMERLLQSTGKSTDSMIAQGVGAVINIVLDPIFIFGLFGMPRLEVAGAAVATVTGQTIGCIVAVILHVRRNRELSLNFRHFRPSGRMIRDIYKIGVPSIFMQALGSVMTFGFNQILLQFNTTATAVFGAFFKLQTFAILPVIGLGNGIVPIISYNYGFRSRKRIMQTVKLALSASVLFMLLGTVVFCSLPDVLLRFFDASPAMMHMGIPALRIGSLSFPLAGIGIISSAFFQSMGDAFYSLIISTIRQIVLILPIAYLLSRLIGLSAVWYAFPISELVAVIVSVFLFIHEYRKKIHVL